MYNCELGIIIINILLIRHMIKSINYDYDGCIT